MKPLVFVDTSALLALAGDRDQYRERAVGLWHDFARAGGRLIGTTLVLAELHLHVLHQSGPARARAVLDGALKDPRMNWRDVTVELAMDAERNWLARFQDQSLSLCDAVSFEVMRREKLTYAFAFDRHFEVAGYRLLR